MKNIVLPILVMSVLLFSCKKKEIEPLPTSNSPVFLMEGEFDGQTISHTAGDNGMVLNSGIEERNGVKYSFAQFSDGQTDYKFGVFDGNIAIPDNFKAYQPGDSILCAKEATQTLAYLSPSLMTNGFKVANVDWYANGVLLDGGADNVNLTDPGVYFIRGEFTFNDANSTIKNVVNRMYLGFDNDVDFSVRHLVTDPNEVKLWIEGATGSIDSIQWYIDGQYVWTGETCSKDIGNSTKDVAAQVYYSNGSIQQKKIVVDGSHQGLYVEDFNVFMAPDQELRWDYKMGVEVEKNGQTYSSFDVSNNKGAMLVKKVDYYKHPITGQEMIRLETEIDTKLKSTSTGEIVEMKVQAVLGLPAQE